MQIFHAGETGISRSLARRILVMCFCLVKLTTLKIRWLQICSLSTRVIKRTFPASLGIPWPILAGSVSPLIGGIVPLAGIYFNGFLSCFQCPSSPLFHAKRREHFKAKTA